MSGVGRPGRNSRQKKAREGGLDGDRQGPWLKPGRSSICESVQLFCEPTAAPPPPQQPVRARAIPFDTDLLVQYYAYVL